MTKQIDIGALMNGAACACGRAHAAHTAHILVAAGAVHELGGVLTKCGLTGRALIVADANTYAAAGDAVRAALAQADIASHTLVLHAGELHVDEHTVGSVLMALDDGVTFLVAVGSGTINDTCRFVARRTGLPYLVVGTAPSMDGYASDVTPVVRAGMKITFPGVAPVVVVGDTDILKSAPLNMSIAGVGDVFGKHTALADWHLARVLTGEYHCEAVAGIVQQAVDACMDAAPGLPGGDAAALAGLMNGLVLSGLAMQMVGNSRPASGAEHHISHFLEMRDMQRGRAGTLHGEKVGMAELIVLRLYEKFFSGAAPVVRDMKPRDAMEQEIRAAFGSTAEQILAESTGKQYDPAYRADVLQKLGENWDALKGMVPQLMQARLAGEAALIELGGAVRPAQLGYDRQDMLDALRYAMEVRERFTILRLAALCGTLDALAEELVQEFC